ncbi:MAG: helix-turn-helix domain-containing protein [Solirubrobacterales bacterium]
MQAPIGATLREARNRRKVQLSEVESAIKIRARYLRAIENEEWDALPGGSYPRAFIRTYANYLGLDGPRLAAEHAGGPEPARRERAPRVDPGPIGTGAAARSPRLSGRATGAIVVACVVALLLAVGLATGGGPGGPVPNSTQSAGSHGAGARTVGAPGLPTRTMGGRGVVISLATRAEVWVCVLDGRGRPLVNGVVLAGGEKEGPFHSDSFTVAFGNGEVAMDIDGKNAKIPASANPLGYSIDSAGHLTPLAEAERPTCL